MIPNLKKISPRPIRFHEVKRGNFFIHIAETTRLLQKIGEAHIKVIKGTDEGCIFSYYGGYLGTEYSKV